MEQNNSPPKKPDAEIVTEAHSLRVANVYLSSPSLPTNILCRLLFELLENKNVRKLLSIDNQKTKMKEYVG